MKKKPNFETIVIKRKKDLLPYKKDLLTLSLELICDQTGKMISDVALLQKAYDFNFDLESFAGNRFVLAIYENKVIGYMSVSIPRRKDDVIKIMEIVVCRGWRKSGVGKKLFITMCKYLLENYNPITLMVEHYPSNKIASDFYRSVGMKDVARMDIKSGTFKK
jgi:ribosomal protein S18 acetylase RimI-like enzyme